MHPDVVQGDHYRERTRGRHEANRRDYAQVRPDLMFAKKHALNENPL